MITFCIIYIVWYLLHRAAWCYIAYKTYGPSVFENVSFVPLIPIYGDCVFFWILISETIMYINNKYC